MLRLASFLALASVLLAAPSASAADSVTLEVPETTVVETPVRIVARGTVDPDRRLFLYTEPGGARCAPTPAEQKLRADAVEQTYRYVSPPDFLDVVTPTFGEAAAVLVCAYVGAAPDEPPATVASAAVTVRNPAVRLSLRRRGRTVRLRGETEVPRGAFVYATRGRGPCAADAEREASRGGARELLFRSIEGSFRQTLFLPPGLRGPVRVCAYAARTQDAAPDARAALNLR